MCEYYYPITSIFNKFGMEAENQKLPIKIIINMVKGGKRKTTTTAATTTIAIIIAFIF
jgi:hypothetical protein